MKDYIVHKMKWKSVLQVFDKIVAEIANMLQNMMSLLQLAKLLCVSL